MEAICIQVKRDSDVPCSSKSEAPQVCEVLQLEVLPLIKLFFNLCGYQVDGNGQYQDKSLGGSRAFTTYCGIPTKERTMRSSA